MVTTHTYIPYICDIFVAKSPPLVAPHPPSLRFRGATGRENFVSRRGLAKNHEGATHRGQFPRRPVAISGSGEEMDEETKMLID